MAPDKGLPAAQRSDLSSIKKWWRTLGGDGFAVLPPPTRSRYTQSDGHEDAAEMFATRSLPPAPPSPTGTGSPTPPSTAQAA